MPKQIRTAHAQLERRLQARRKLKQEQGLERTPPAPSERHGISYVLHGKRVVSFCSNDYLGLAAQTEPSVAAESTSGSAASALVSGYQPELQSAEKTISEMTGADATILAPSGFQANLIAIPTVIEATDLVYSDELNHGSLIDGLRLARSQNLTILKHLEAPPERNIENSTDQICWWVLEFIFSMDGDGPKLSALETFLNTGGHILLDCSHSFGIDTKSKHLHKTFKGQIVQTSGLGKAAGLFGGTVSSSQTIIESIRTTARAYVFSTAISPAHSQRIRARVVQLSSTEGNTLREKLQNNIKTLHQQLGSLSKHAPSKESPIIPIILGENQRAIDTAEQLMAEGWHVQAIRPPTVPDGKSRLRITISALHTSEHITQFSDALKRILKG